MGYKTVKEKALNKPLLGHLAKAGVSPLRHLIEYRLEDASAYTLGQEITAAIFQEGDLVDVAGTTIGRGFSGYQKRHNFKRGNMTHGSKNHRLPGSTGAGTTPAASSRVKEWLDNTEQPKLPSANCPWSKSIANAT